ncbi:MAG: DUF2812 domain-containing protein, partial [Lachnospiraceae bacterium]|nr:DUF2812 domain-containing protein [Lachnospiraceae bacterium]
MKTKDKDQLIQNRAIAYENLDDTKEYLEDMAKEGWMLEKISGTTKFFFRRCEPVDARFAVEIFVNGSMFDTHVIESNMEYIEYCKKAGWEFVCSSANIDVFRTDDEDAPEIESDRKLKLKAIKKAGFSQRIATQLMLLVMGVIYIVFSLTVNRNVMESSFMAFSALLMWLFAGGLTVYNLVSYLLWLGKAQTAVDNDEKIPRRKIMGYKEAWGFLTVFGILHSAFSIFAGIVYNEKAMFMMPVIWLVIILLMFVTRRVTVFAEKKKLGRTGYAVLIMVVIPLCTLVLLLNVIIFVVLTLGNSDASGKSIGTQGISSFGSSKDIVSREEHTTHWGHFLVSIDRYTLEAYNADRERQLEAGDEVIQLKDGEDYCPVTYTWSFDIYDTKVKAIHDRILREAKEGIDYRMLGIRFEYDKAREETALESAGKSVYRYDETDSDGSITYTYLIYDEEVIVFALCDEELTGQQMAVINGSFM